MADRVRVGFVGTGGIATEFHLPALKEIEGVEITALCDVAKERAEEAATAFGGRVYGDHRRMLDEEDLDALFVCLPPFAHTDAELIAAQKKIHLFVEKPIALDMEQGIEMQTGTGGGIMKGLMRMFTGESFFITAFYNNGRNKSRVAFAAPYPGKIIPLDLSALGGRFLCQKDSFLCAEKSTEIEVAFTKRIGAGLFGGEGFTRPLFLFGY